VDVVLRDRPGVECRVIAELGGHARLKDADVVRAAGVGLGEAGQSVVDNDGLLRLAVVQFARAPGNSPLDVPDHESVTIRPSSGVPLPELMLVRQPRPR
jgi:hypothetical protein